MFSGTVGKKKNISLRGKSRHQVNPIVCPPFLTTNDQQFIFGPDLLRRLHFLYKTVSTPPRHPEHVFSCITGDIAALVAPLRPVDVREKYAGQWFIVGIFFVQPYSLFPLLFCYRDCFRAERTLHLACILPLLFRVHAFSCHLCTSAPNSFPATLLYLA